MIKRREFIALFMFACIITMFLFNVSVYAGDGPASSEGDDYNVTFYAHVDPGITEITNYVYVGVQNTENNSLYYEYTLYQANNFLLMVQLPEGQYRIVGGGIRNDFSGKYPVEYVTFTVENSRNVLVEFDIGTPDSVSAEPANTPEPSEDPTSTIITDTQNPTEGIVNTDTEIPTEGIISADTENPTEAIEPSATAIDNQKNEKETLPVTTVITFSLFGIAGVATVICVIMVIKRKRDD